MSDTQPVSGEQGTSSRSRSTARMLMPSSHSTRRISPRSYRFTSCSRRLHIMSKSCKPAEHAQPHAANTRVQPYSLPEQVADLHDLLRLGKKDVPQLGALCERRLAGGDRLPGNVGIAPQRQREPLLPVFESCLRNQMTTALPPVTSCVSSSDAGMPVLHRKFLSSARKRSIGTASVQLGPSVQTAPSC